MKVFITFLTACIISFLLYSGIQMHQFAEGVKNDTARFKHFKLRNEIQEGDIIFQTSQSSQSKAIQLATHSKYSHMGIIFKRDNQYVVYEAIQPVQLTSLKKWIVRGQNGHYIVKRLKNAETALTEDAIKKMKQVGSHYLNKPYDIHFEWSDDKIYCSELVWKIYKEATGIEVGSLQHLSDFDLRDKVVQSKMKERYGNNTPLDEPVISPAAMFHSDKLITVAGN
ncbi:YiiX family permuted papain-like enzyme [Aureibacter tunicatorum]|uniref:Uncharacterized protein YycO n=1 Tax=Aureibacter tunicatorum TaxID=866807 RepID=A0AAE3XL27_9BACT|nr:YiiX family permuted papain-like enzyme [Aureibacter tunicatorum]MDR6238490.1 uncharacterized protein YycO [Aureibacter tunicatorum]BDD05577.1 hypothetical protein AUTU_30600 [Aureibacter tunicatorum]